MQENHPNLPPLCAMLSTFPDPIPSSFIAHNLRQSLGSVALVRADNLPINQLLVGVSRIDDEAPISDGKSREARARPELITPAAAHKVRTAGDAVVGCVRRGVAGHVVGARGQGAGVEGE